MAVAIHVQCIHVHEWLCHVRGFIYDITANVQAYFAAVYYIGPNKMLRTRLFVCP